LQVKEKQNNHADLGQGMIFARLSSRRGTEIFAANPVPTITFCPVLEEVMREDNGAKTGQSVTSRTQVNSRPKRLQK